MSIIGTAVAGAAASQLVGGLVGGAVGVTGSAAAGAASAQSNAQALQNTQQIAQLTNNNLQPYQTLGGQAATTLGSMLNTNATGPNGPGLLSTFNNADLNANLAPNYNFALAQGLGAQTNLGASGQVAPGGNTETALTAYGTNYAQNAYQQAFNNFQTSQNNIYNRLSNTANAGANASTVGATGATQFGGLEGQYITGQGNAIAQGITGATNAVTGGINQVAGANTISSLAQGIGGTNTGNYVPGTGGGLFGGSGTTYANAAGQGIIPM
jgi:hypothetical protein